jgi:hypothetical protein
MINRDVSVEEGVVYPIVVIDVDLSKVAVVKRCLGVTMRSKECSQM